MVRLCVISSFRSIQRSNDCVYTCKIKRFLVYPINLLSPKEEKQYVEKCLLLPFNTTQQTVPYLHPCVPKQRSVGARMVRTKNYTKELETRKNLADPINIGPDFKKKERKKVYSFPDRRNNATTLHIHVFWTSFCCSMLDWRDETSQGAQQHVTLVISSGINNKPFSLCLLYSTNYCWLICRSRGCKSNWRWRRGY